jgi:hypothetical protein
LQKENLLSRERLSGEAGPGWEEGGGSSLSSIHFLIRAIDVRFDRGRIDFYATLREIFSQSDAKIDY